jgi:hypothetical protein
MGKLKPEDLHAIYYRGHWFMATRPNPSTVRIHMVDSGRGMDIDFVNTQMIEIPGKNPVERSFDILVHEYEDGVIDRAISSADKAMMYAAELHDTTGWIKDEVTSAAKEENAAEGKDTAKAKRSAKK